MNTSYNFKINISYSHFDYRQNINICQFDRVADPNISSVF